MKRALLVIAELPLLTACQRQDNTQARIARLEQQVDDLQRQLDALRAHSLTWRAANLTQAAAADSCALVTSAAT